jgi:hypothetical protein
MSDLKIASNTIKYNSMQRQVKNWIAKSKSSSTFFC